MIKIIIKIKLLCFNIFTTIIISFPNLVFKKQQKHQKTTTKKTLKMSQKNPKILIEFFDFLINILFFMDNIDGYFLEKVTLGFLINDQFQRIHKLKMSLDLVNRCLTIYCLAP